MKKKKIFLVKREVITTSLKQALTKPGRIYEVIQVEAKDGELDNEKDKIGFTK